MQVINGTDLKRMMAGAAHVLAQAKDEVNALNVFPVPDGDTGTNMALTIQSALRELDNLDTDNISRVAQAIARGSLMGARGNSGVILSQYFRGFSDGLGKAKTATGKTVAQAFLQASATTYKAVMKPVEGTMLTVGRAIAEACEEACEENEELCAIEAWKIGITAGKVALDNISNILPVLKQAGVVDAGGKGLLLALEGAYLALINELDYSSSESSTVADSSAQEGIQRLDEVLVNKYCTEFLIQGQSIDMDKLRQRLEPLGDSLLVVGDESVVKIHIHTDYPGKALDISTKLGDVTGIEIDNMQLQNATFTDETSNQNNVVNFPINKAANAESNEEPKPIGIVAVVPGDGLTEIFSSLGVDIVIHGGQTMNPSTEELVRAVEQVNGESVIILPNNKNVIFSAEQVKEFVDLPVEVIPTKTVPQGIAALVGFGEHLELAENVKNMHEEIKHVRTGEITYAVRSTKAGELDIAEQDFIGLADGKIVTAGQSLADVGFDLLDNLVDDNSSLISIYVGEDQDMDEAETFKGQIEERFTQCEVELYHGGQPLYYYIMSVE